MQICNWTGIFADTEGFAVTVADLLSAPSAAPTFAFGHLLCPHRKKCCATARIFFERSLRFKTFSSIFIVWILKKTKGQKKTSWFLKKFKGGCCRFCRYGRKPPVCSLHGAYVRFRAPPVPSSEKMLRHCSHFFLTAHFVSKPAAAFLLFDFWK